MRWALVLLAGCTIPTAPDTFEAPAIYRTWYAETWEACGSTLRSSPAYAFDVLRFHVADFPPSVLGYWEGYDIYLAGDMTLWAPAVKHEMLHAQLGEPGHPDIFATCSTLGDDA